MSSVDVCLTHQQLENYQHHDKNVVVIDVLRATSTINTILFSGAKSVKPVESLEECMKLKEDGFIVSDDEEDIEYLSNDENFEFR